MSFYNFLTRVKLLFLFLLLWSLFHLAGLYEYPDYYVRLLVEFGVNRDFVTQKAAPSQAEWKGY
jgi:hypothetical protein